jgi:penicillin-binding protein 1C
LFDVFNQLPRKAWFLKPLNNLYEAEVCKLSGYLAQNDCPKTMQLIPKNGLKSGICPFHKLVFLDVTEHFRVNSSCENIENMVIKSWVFLPLVMESYYKNSHINYYSLPPFLADCAPTQQKIMDFIYPRTISKIYLAKDFKGKTQSVILKVAHSNSKAKLFWYLDNQYLGETKTFHEMAILAKTGKHYITVTDDLGNEISRNIEIINN